MKTTERQTDRGYVVELGGRLDVRVAPELRECLSAAMTSAEENRLVVDLRPVDFIDSTTVAVLINIHRMVEKRGGKMALVAPEAPARKIFSLTKTDEYLTVCDSLDEAFAAK